MTFAMEGGGMRHAPGMAASRVACFAEATSSQVLVVILECEIVVGREWPAPRVCTYGRGATLMCGS